jgi:ribosome-binding factor A
VGEIKIERVRQKVHAECARIIRGLNDPRAGFITVQKVELAADFRNAKIFVSLMGTDGQKRTVMRMLKDATGYIQRGVAGRLRTRVTPELLFVLDTSIDKSFKVAAILDQIKKERGEPLERSDDLADSDAVAAEGEEKPAEKAKPPKKKKAADHAADDEDEESDDDGDWDDEEESDDDDS